jgi:hypothetical protein
MSVEHEKSPSRFSWLKPKQSEKLDSASVSETGEKRTSTELRVSTPTPVEPPKPVSLIGLFRYFFSPSHSYRFLTTSVPSFSTRTELILNAIGLVSAVAAGAAQVCLPRIRYECPADSPHSL